MPLKSQIRLSQLTGSFAAAGDSRSIITTEPQKTLAAMNLADLSGSLSHIASAIGRIHGKPSGEFADNADGEFYHQVKVSHADGIILGAGGNEFSITESSDDVTLASLIQDKDMIFTVNDNGTTVEVFRLDGDVGHMKMDSSRQIQFGAAARHIADNGSDIVITSGNDVVIAGTAKLEFNAAGSGEHVTGDGNDLTAASGRHIILDPTSDLQIKAGTVDLTDAQKNFTLLDNDGDAISFDAAGQADILKIDTSNGAEKVVIHALDVSNALNANGDLTVAGNLTVNGTTSTVNSTTVTIDDQFLFLADGAQTRNTPAGIVFASGSNQAARPDVSFARIANDLWALGSVASNSGSTSNSVPSNFDIGFRALNFEVVSNSNMLDLNGSQLRLKSGGGHEFDLAGVSDVIDIGHGGTSKGLISFGSSNEFHVSGTVGKIQLQSATGGVEILDTHDGSNPRSIFTAQYSPTSQASVIQFDNSRFAAVNATGGNALQLGHFSGGFLELGTLDGGAKMGFSPLQLSGSYNAAGSGEYLATIVVGGAQGSFGSDVIGASKAKLVVSGSSLRLDHGVSGSASLEFKSDNSSVVSLAAPANLASNVSLTLPPDDGNSGDVLVTDGSGVLTFASAGGSANSSKRFGTVSAAINPNTLVAFSTGATFVETTSALDVSKVAAADRINNVDVYVNGQLLMSGTSAPGSNVAGGDYVLVDVNGGGGFAATETDADLKFAFRLEADDVISVIVRA